MSYLSDSGLAGVVKVPLNVPQVELVAQAPALPVAQFQLQPGQIFRAPYLSLHFIGYRTIGFLERVNSGMPVAYAGIYYQTQATGDWPAARPILLAGSDAPGVSVMPSSPIEFAAPGFYRVMLINNHASSNISALVTGIGYVMNVNANG